MNNVAFQLPNGHVHHVRYKPHLWREAMDRVALVCERERVVPEVGLKLLFDIERQAIEQGQVERVERWQPKPSLLVRAWAALLVAWHGGQRSVGRWMGYAHV